MATSKAFSLSFGGRVEEHELGAVRTGETTLRVEVGKEAQALRSFGLSHWDHRTLSTSEVFLPQSLNLPLCRQQRSVLPHLKELGESGAL